MGIGITGQLHILPRRKILPSSSVENVSSAVIEASTCSLNVGENASDVTCYFGYAVYHNSKSFTYLTFLSLQNQICVLTACGDSEVGKTFALPCSNGG